MYTCCLLVIESYLNICQSSKVKLSNVQLRIPVQIILKPLCGQISLTVAYIYSTDAYYPTVILMTILSWTSLKFGYSRQFQWMVIDWSPSGGEIYNYFLTLWPSAIHHWYCLHLLIWYDLISSTKDKKIIIQHAFYQINILNFEIAWLIFVIFSMFSIGSQT